MIEEFGIVEDFLRPGALLRASEPDGRTLDIRAVVDDEWIVFRFRVGRAWQYNINHVSIFELFLANGYLRPSE